MLRHLGFSSTKYSLPGALCAGAQSPEGALNGFPPVTTIPFTRAQFEAAPKKLLREGRAANARVSCVEMNGKLWTVKDFSSRSWIVRHTVAPIFLKRELAFIERLRGIEGFADAGFRLDKDAIAVAFLPGRPYGDFLKTEIKPDFLEALEKLVAAMHARGVVHLDLRGAWNVMVRPDGGPAIIDFQSSLFTDRMPKRLRTLLEDFDRSGVLKKWRRCCPNEMGEARRAELERINRLRRWWIFRGYFGMKKPPKQR